MGNEDAGKSPAKLWEKRRIAHWELMRATWEQYNELVAEHEAHGFNGRNPYQILLATLEAVISEEPSSRILTIERVAQAICEAVGEDAADGVMMLLTAAAHIAQQHARKGVKVEDALADSLGNAILAAKSFFPE